MNVNQPSNRAYTRRAWRITLPASMLAVAAILLFAQPDSVQAAPPAGSDRAVESVGLQAIVPDGNSNPGRGGNLSVDAGTSTASAADDVQPLATYYLNRTDTQRLWLAWSVGGGSALVGLCALLRHPALIAICAPVMAVIAVYFANATRPNGRCLAVTTRFGWPPVSVGYITCP